MRVSRVSRVRRVRQVRRLTVAVLVLLAVVTLGVQRDRPTHAVFPLLSETVAIDGLDRLQPVTTTRADVLQPGTRVLASSMPAAAELAVQQREWLGRGSIPGIDGPYATMAAYALLDLRTLTLANGALVAGTPGPWRYVWPRDASFAAVAMARTGHWRNAVEILAYLQRMQPADGVFQARYLPDGSGRAPDGRGVQSDGIGWALWAADETVRAAPSPAARVEVLRRLQPLILTSTRAAMRLTGGQLPLPPASQDYWEITDSRLSLGTAAPIALGLRRGADLLRLLGRPVAAAKVGARSAGVYQAIYDRFGPYGYPRYLNGFTRDASITFLLPGFRVAPRIGVVQAYLTAMDTSQRPEGGNAPGAGWAQDGVSWTPQTGLYAMTAAALGDRDRAVRTLDWLRAHTTPFASVPEKVLADGRPAGPAPVALTAAIVVLAVLNLDNLDAPG